MGIRRRELLETGALGVAALALPAWARATDQSGTLPATRTEGAFDAAALPAYAGRHDAVYGYIDAHRDEHVQHLRRWVQQPSVSAEGTGIEAMATMLRDDLRALGAREAEFVPTGGHPGVWGFFDAGAPRTLMVYMMYDVQPAEPEDWRVPPFEGALLDHERGKVLMARGATNQKGPERAFLNAVEAILATEGRLPVNLMITAEGEEELGSPHYPEIVDRYEERLRTADGVIFPRNAQNALGDTRMTLGVKGIVYFEVEALGGPHGGPTRAEIHSSLKAIVDAPALRLVHALAALTTPDGNRLRIPGYTDPIRRPTPEEKRLMAGILPRWNESALRQVLGVERWIDDLEGQAALLRYLFATTINIDGIWGGYSGPGTKTILPHKATAKVDSRLVPDQRPDDALARIRRHLDTHGFGDVSLRKLAGYPPAQTSVEAPLVQAAIGVYNKHGHTPAVWPRSAGSAPFYQFTERLALPLVPAGLGHGSGAHAPNEYMVIEPASGSRVAGLAEIEKAHVDLLYALAAASA
jgi:acetylornithine deacetylase/succinyl-diaminopimelate desuccinylase-like protein